MKLESTCYGKLNSEEYWIDIFEGERLVRYGCELSMETMREYLCAQNFSDGEIDQVNYCLNCDLPHEMIADYLVNAKTSWYLVDEDNKRIPDEDIELHKYFNQ